jgi:hypothetical protein
MASSSSQRHAAEHWRGVRPKKRRREFSTDLLFYIFKIMDHHIQILEFFWSIMKIVLMSKKRLRLLALISPLSLSFKNCFEVLLENSLSEWDAITMSKRYRKFFKFHNLKHVIELRGVVFHSAKSGSQSLNF